MPVNFLNASERTRLSQFPQDISESDLIQYFTLTADDRVEVQRQRQAPNQLGFALQLCALRYLGYCPDDLQQTPAKILEFIAKQLTVTSDVLGSYGKRAQTRTDHFQQVQQYLGFRMPTPQELKQLEQWLLERALEHDKPSFLFQQAADKLYADQIVRPGVTVLERMVSTVRNQAMQVTYKLMKPLLKSSGRKFLDQLLVNNDDIHAIRLTWLRRPATSNSPREILRVIEKIHFLRAHQVHDWDLSALNPNRLKFLARIAQKSSIKSLRRMPVERRYPLLIAFAQQLLIEATDEAADLYIRCLADTQARARRDLKEFRLREAVAINEKVRLLRQLGEVILDPQVEDSAVRPDIFERVSQERLEAAINDCERLVRPAQDESTDYFAARYSYLRQFAPAFLKTFTFRSNRKKDPLLEAIEVLRELNETGKRQVPQDTPMDFISSSWKPYILDEQGKIQRRYYELSVLWELRHTLRSGNVWIEGSRRYANPESYLIPKEKWSQMSTEFCQMMALPQTGQERLVQLDEQLNEQMTQLVKTLKDNPDIRLEYERIVISPLDAQEEPQRIKTLKALVNQCLPQVDLTDLLIEVDQLTGFSDALVHSGGNQSRSPDTKLYLYAAILAQACNLGPATMARVSGLSYDSLVWHTNWFLDDDNLSKAITILVNYHHQLPLSQAWGGGMLSSSDGQRFPVTVKNTKAVPLPRYFGYGKGVTFYTWLSDQFSQYGAPRKIHKILIRSTPKANFLKLKVM